ncbi:class I SAM-dependent methyltransferase [Myxococcota bacterium]|nr:class I SAM-dependent methyltransferase [Myxococcota bacterium]
MISIAPPVAPVHEAAHRFSAYLAELERRLRRSTDEVPTLEVKREAAGKLWTMLATLRRASAAASDQDLEPAKREVRQILGPWLWRSEHFHRAFHKPHGFAGDYETLKLSYDLETSDCADPMKPALVNCLDYCFATLPAVQALWERRRRLAAELERVYVRNGRRLSVLDVGCGSAPYLRDFLEHAGDGTSVSLMLVDRDPSALRYLQRRTLAPWNDRIATSSASVGLLHGAVPSKSFDVVIACGVTDELDDELARDAVSLLVDAVKPGGELILSNAHTADTSHCAFDWLLDWRPVRRDEERLADLVPGGIDVTPDRSASNALAYAFATR